MATECLYVHEGPTIPNSLCECGLLSFTGV
jgi:hypothetical protein